MSAMGMMQDADLQAASAAAATGAIIGGVIALVFGVVLIAAMWKIFSKAGQPGWASLVPIYNLIVLSKITGRAWWWAFVPVLNFIFMIMTPFDLAKSFGKGGGFGFGLLALPYVFYPMLGFGGASYAGPSVAA
jgi:Family of unknown function (DUF5684)